MMEEQVKKSFVHKREQLARVLPLKMPYVIYMFPIYACNFKCEYCIHSLDRSLHGGISEETVMPWEIYKKTIDDLHETGQKIKMLCFIGIGEPLLHPQIVEMVAYAKKREVADHIEIVSNGSLLTRELSDCLIEAGLSKLRISLQGLSSEEYLERSSAKVNFEELVENLRYFYERCENTDTTMYIKIIDYMVQRREQQDEFFRIFGTITHEIAIEHLSDMYDGVDYKEISQGVGMNKSRKESVLLEASICPQPFYMLQVKPGGEVVPCCGAKAPLVLGNVKEMSIQDIWTGVKCLSFQRTMLDGVNGGALKFVRNVVIIVMP